MCVQKLTRNVKYDLNMTKSQGNEMLAMKIDINIAYYYWHDMRQCVYFEAGWILLQPKQRKIFYF